MQLDRGVELDSVNWLLDIMHCIIDATDYITPRLGYTLLVSGSVGNKAYVFAA